MNNYRTIVWHIGQSQWRGIMTAIWHEVGQMQYNSDLYNGIDGPLSVRYKQDIINPKYNDNWVNEILNRNLLKDEGLGFVDTGLVGEYELKEWLGAGMYRLRAFTEDMRVRNIILQWDKDANITEIRRWYNGHLGIFSETGFKDKIYYEEMCKIIEQWEQTRNTWREFKKQFGNIKRCKLQFYEEYIFASLMAIIK